MRLIGVKLSVISAIAVVALSYTNCSKVDFEVADLEATSQALGFKDGALILINEGAEYTNSRSVSLRLEHNDAEEMMISDRADCSGGVWEPMARKKAWTLATANNHVVVYARFRRFFAEKWIESACVSDGIVHDDIAPVVLVQRDPGSLFNRANLNINVSAQDSGSGVGSVRCQSTWSSGCNLNVKNHTLSEGAHSIQISATDRAGNVSEIVTDALTVDLTPPVVSFTSVPPARTAQAATRFEFSAVDALSGVAGFECAVDGGGFSSCVSGALQNFAQGDRRFQVRAVDKAGNVSAPIAHAWTIDLTAPTVEILSGPAGFIKTNSATFTYRGSDDGQPLNQFKCRIDGGAESSCDSGSKSYASLNEGPHTFEVVAVDGASLRSEPAQRQFFVDTRAPQISIGGSQGRQSSSSASFTFSATDSGSGIKLIECRMDSGPYGDCGTSKTYANLPPGNRIITARAVDNAGNFSGEVTRAVFIDAVKPVVQITRAPASEITVTNAEFEFVASDADGGTISSIECRMDSAAWTACTSPKIFEELPKGERRFEVRATDSVGLVSDVAVHVFTVRINDPVIICDPFGSTTKVKPGIAAKLAYYDGPTPGVISYVEDVWTKGTIVNDTVLLFGNISVPTRSFRDGFDIGSGQKLVNSRGERLIEWFSLDYQAEVKLADDDAEGLYQFGLLSDDGSILWLDDGNGMQEIVNNDGHTPTRMKCGGTVQMSRASRIPMRMKYFQGPKDEIAVTMLWRKVKSGQTNFGCDSASGWFSGGAPTSKYESLIAQGWKVMSPGNFQMKEVIPNNCAQ